MLSPLLTARATGAQDFHSTRVIVKYGSQLDSAQMHRRLEHQHFKIRNQFALLPRLAVLEDVPDPHAPPKPDAARKKDLRKRIEALRRKCSSPVPPVFRWRKNGAPLSNNSQVFGVSTHQLLLVGVQGGDIGNYSVEVRNSAGSVVSNEAALGVNTAFRLQVLSAPSPGHTTFSFEVGGPVGSLCGVEVSSNLADWVPLAVFTNTSGLVRITDPASVDHPLRFYRAVLIPE